MSRPSSVTPDGRAAPATLPKVGKRSTVAAILKGRERERRERKGERKREKGRDQREGEEERGRLYRRQRANLRSSAMIDFARPPGNGWDSLSSLPCCSFPTSQRTCIPPSDLSQQ